MTGPRKAPGSSPHAYTYYPNRGEFVFSAAALSELIRRIGMPKEACRAEDDRLNEEKIGAPVTENHRQDVALKLARPPTETA